MSDGLIYGGCMGIGVVIMMIIDKNLSVYGIFAGIVLATFIVNSKKEKNENK